MRGETNVSSAGDLWKVAELFILPTGLLLLLLRRLDLSGVLIVERLGSKGVL